MFDKMIYGKRLLKNVGTLTSIRYSRNVSERNFSDTKNQKNWTSLHYDKNEIEHHESIAKKWWDINGPMKPLHAMNEMRISLIRNGLVNTRRLKVSDIKTNEKYLNGVQILDVGCGGGILSENLARLGASVTGIDPSEELIKLATFHANNNREGFIAPKYIPTTVEEHSEQNHQVYDAVVASEVIEHVSKKESFIKGCIAALKPGGSLFITTPHKTWLSYLGNIFFAEYILRMLPVGTHTYEKFISPEDLSSLLEKEGCKTQLVNGMFYDVLRNKWLWTSTSALVYGLHATK